MNRTLRHVHATDEDHKVTTLELFFDLVFVFAITQVTQLMADDATARGAVRGLVLLALLWFAWASFAWLGNSAKADEGLLRLCLVGAVIAMFVVALAVPEAFGDREGGLHAPLLLAIAYFARAARAPARLPGGRSGRQGPAQAALPDAGGGGHLGRAAGRWRRRTGAGLWWLAAIVVDYGGIYFAGWSGWRLPSPAHFAERHGLIVLIAIGESMVSVGAGVAGTAAHLGDPGRGDGGHRRRPWRSGGSTSTWSRSSLSGCWQSSSRRSGRGWRATPTPTCTSRWSPASCSWRSA